MNIRMLQTVEDQVTGFLDDASVEPKAKNDVAARRGAVLSRRETDEMVTITVVMPEGGEFAVSDRQAKRLVDLGYAEEIEA